MDIYKSLVDVIFHQTCCSKVKAFFTRNKYSYKALEEELHKYFPHRGGADPCAEGCDETDGATVVRQRQGAETGGRQGGVKGADGVRWRGLRGRGVGRGG